MILLCVANRSGTRKQFNAVSRCAACRQQSGRHVSRFLWRPVHFRSLRRVGVGCAQRFYSLQRASTVRDGSRRSVLFPIVAPKPTYACAGGLSHSASFLGKRFGTVRNVRSTDGLLAVCFLDILRTRCFISLCLAVSYAQIGAALSHDRIPNRTFRIPARGVLADRKYIYDQASGIDGRHLSHGCRTTALWILQA